MTDVEARAELARLERLARLLDASIGIPGTRYTVGIDALIGLLPGVGDALTAAVKKGVLTGRRVAVHSMLARKDLDDQQGRAIERVVISGEMRYRVTLDSGVVLLRKNPMKNCPIRSNVISGTPRINSM